MRTNRVATPHLPRINVDTHIDHAQQQQYLPHQIQRHPSPHYNASHLNCEGLTSTRWSQISHIYAVLSPTYRS